MSKQIINGRAFEWSIGEVLTQDYQYSICESNYSRLAKESFDQVSTQSRKTFLTASKTALENISQKEHFFLGRKSPGKIHFNSDSAGESGDVRDLILEISGKTLGISCKNNHSALKHSRLSSTIDFVKKWGLNSEGCSNQYWDAVSPLFKSLRIIQEESNGNTLWASINNKAELYYWPILEAWKNEIQRVFKLGQNDSAELCRGLITYLVGNHDFYKIKCERMSRVHIQGWNFNKTLAIKKTNYPDTILAMHRVNGGKYSMTITFNHGFSINFRIHNASRRVEPSLKFDINAMGLPPEEIYQQTIELVK